MSNQADSNNSDSRTALIVLSYLTEELQQAIPEHERGKIRDEFEAREAIASFVNQISENREQLSAEDISLDDRQAEALGPAILDVLGKDEAIRPKVEELTTDLPEDAQMSVELALAGAVILGAVITWLQTKVEITVTKKNGKSEFYFKLNKDATDASLIKDVANSLVMLLTGIPNPENGS
jgi:hypothetical protein